MGHEVDRIYCCDRGCDDNNNWLTASLLGRGGFGNNFSELFVLLLATRMFGGFGFDGGFGGAQGQQNIEVQNQLQAIRSQMQDNQNSNLLMDAINGVNGSVEKLSNALNCDFNTLNSCCCDLKQAIASVAGQIGYSKEAIIAAIGSGNCNVIQAIKDCCCQTQRQISDFRADVQLQTCQQTNTLREGQRNLGQAMSEGFSKVGFQQQQDKCDILRAIQDSQQKTADMLNQHWRDELSQQNQDLKFQLSQERQNRYLAAIARGENPGNYSCGCGCGF